MIKSSIENDLLRYTEKIYDEGIFNKHNEKINAEDFFCRLFKLIYGWSDLVNLNYLESNSAGIDLYSANQKIAIQITTIQSKEKEKVEGTIKKVLKHHSDKKIEGIICFFIKDNRPLKNIDVNELSEEFGIKIKIRTTKNIIGDFYRFPSPEKKIRISEIVKQETSSDFKGIDSLEIFEPYYNRKISKYTTPESLIYFSAFEKNKIQEIQELFNNDKIKEYCILGNPCSGKSTLANAILKNLKPYYKVYYIDLSDPDLNNNNVLSEINQLSFYHTIILLENVHDNIKLFNKVQQKIIRFPWLKGLYISRYHNSYREEDENSIRNIFKDIEKFRYNPNKIFEEKVSGIIDNRVKSLKDEFPQFNWYVGDFQTVLNNTDRNLLKLNIALETWISSTKKGSNIKFEKINNERIYSHFYTTHKLKELDKKLLFLYSYLYSYDISFLRIKRKKDEFDLLKEKGIILNYNTSDYYYFPHKDYANLIYQSLKKERDLEIEDLLKYLKKYIKNFKTESELNITEIIIKLSYGKELKVVSTLLNQVSVLKLLSNKFSGNIRDYEVFELQKAYFLSFDNLDNDLQVKYYTLFINYFTKHKLELFISKDYSIYSNLIQIAKILNIELGNIFIDLNSKHKEKINSISDLTMKISSSKPYPDTVSRILNSFHFPEWLLMIEKLPTLSRITNSLSELNTSPLSKKLLTGVINKINIQELALKGQKLKTVQITKSLRELKKIDIAIGTDVTNDLMKHFTLDNKIASTNLSDFSKILSDLSSISPDFVETELTESFQNGTFYNILEKEKSINNISASILELKKITISSENLFYELVNKFFDSNVVYNLLKIETNISSLLILFELIKRNEVGINEGVKNKLLVSIKKLILESDYDYTLYSNPKVLNIPELKSKINDEISTELLNKILNRSKFTILDSLFRVLNAINKEKTINALNKADLNIFVQSICNKELNMSQSLEVLFRAKSKTYIDENFNSNSFWYNLLDEYLIIQKDNQYNYHKLNFGDFLKAFEFCLKINTEIALKHFENDFLKKLKSKENFTISSLFQFLRKIEIKTKSKYNTEIQQFLDLNKSKFIEGIKNENIEKTTSGLVELSKCEFGNYVDEFIYNARNTFSTKLKQIKGNKKIEKKVHADLKIIATNKSKFLLNEL
ncbi:SMEK domain-containing protein [Winogradskyella forsetii]|uniref:SMEK domain-containing protein n=1 Tax=Winogradskyella forsetii TaxID=2686077 RepID=UPI0015BAEC7E|nr:SMEK domain-containing protein [Winogradskyella forsetii]